MVSANCSPVVFVVGAATVANAELIPIALHVAILYVFSGGREGGREGAREGGRESESKSHERPGEQSQTGKYKTTRSASSGRGRENERGGSPRAIAVDTVRLH